MNSSSLEPLPFASENFDGGILAYNHDFQVTEWNSVMEQLFSKQREVCLGQNLFELLPEFSEEGEQNLLKSALQGETTISHGKLYSVDVTKPDRLFETRFSPIINGNGSIAGGCVFLKPLSSGTKTTYDPSVADISNWIAELNQRIEISRQGDTAPVCQGLIDILGKSSGFDRGYIVHFEGPTGKVTQCYEWTQENVPSVLTELENLEIHEDLPWLSQQLKDGKRFSISTQKLFPQQEGPELTYLKNQQVESLQLYPFMMQNQPVGVVGFEKCLGTQPTNQLPESLLSNLVQVAINGLVRLQLEKVVIPADKASAALPFQELTNAVSLGVFVVNEEGRCLFVNRRFESIIQLNRNDLLDTGLKNHLFNGQGKSWLPEWRNSIELGGNYTGSFSYVDKNRNQPLWLRLHVSPVVNHNPNGFSGFVGTVEDISAQRNAEEQMIKSERYQRIINYFATSLLGKNTLHDILNDLTHNCISNLDFTDCVIYLLDRKSDMLVQKAGFGKKRDQDNRLIGGMNLPVGKGIVGHVAISKKAEIVSDTTLDARYVIDEELRLSEITVPIIYEGELLGVIDSEHEEKNFFNEDHLRVLSTIASLAANKIVRVQMEDQLAESLERVDLALEGGNLGLWDWDVPTGTMTYNRRWAEMLGYSLRDIEPTVNNWDKVMHPDDKPLIMGELDRHLSGDTAYYESEHRMRTKDGTWKRILDRGKVTKWDRKGNPLRVTGTHLDITERKLAEQALQESEDKFKSAFENASVGMILADKDGRMYQINTAFARMIGYEVHELKEMKFADITVSEDLDENLGLFRQLINGEINSYHLEKRYRHKKGYTITGLLSCSLVREFAGEPSFVIAQVKDITDRKNAEEELRQLTDELLRSNAELNQFAYITSHNLRAPVVNLKSLLMLYNKDNPMDSDNPLIIDKLELSVNQLSATLEDLIQVVAVKHTSQGQSERINLSSLISRVEASISDQMNRAATKVIADFSEAPELTYPKSHLESIVLNLLTNAIKYRSPERSPTIRITSRRERGFFRLSVRDNGLGMDLRKHGDDLFGLYKRFHNHVEGKGLGLYIIKSQVDALGGKIEVDSELGKGTTFNVFLKEGKMHQESR
ncbi:MAG: PAS domain S-box protein [Salibacteraceae bacterium]